MRRSQSTPLGPSTWSLPGGRPASEAPHLPQKWARLLLVYPHTMHVCSSSSVPGSPSVVGIPVPGAPGIATPPAVARAVLGTGATEALAVTGAGEVAGAVAVEACGLVCPLGPE